MYDNQTGGNHRRGGKRVATAAADNNKNSSSSKQQKDSFFEKQGRLCGAAGRDENDFVLSFSSCLFATANEYWQL